MTALQLSFKKLPCISVGLIILQTIPHVTLLFCQIADNLGENTVKQSICRTRFVELLEYVPQWNNGTSSNNPYMVHVKTCIKTSIGSLVKFAECRHVDLGDSTSHDIYVYLVPCTYCAIVWLLICLKSLENQIWLLDLIND